MNTPQQVGKFAVSSIFLVVIIVGILFRYTNPDWPFARIGGLLGLIAVIALLAVEGLNSYARQIDAGVNHWARKLARTIAPFLFAFFLPLTIVAAGYQMIDRDLEVKNNRPDEFIKKYETYFNIFGEEYQVNGEGLLKHLNLNMKNYEALNSNFGKLWFPELLILNCASEKCECREPYVQVKYEGTWNLNAGITGSGGAAVASDKINLCWKRTNYGDFASKP